MAGTQALANPARDGALYCAEVDQRSNFALPECLDQVRRIPRSRSGHAIPYVAKVWIFFTRS